MEYILSLGCNTYLSHGNGIKHLYNDLCKCKKYDFGDYDTSVVTVHCFQTGDIDEEQLIADVASFDTETIFKRLLPQISYFYRINGDYDYYSNEIQFDNYNTSLDEVDKIIDDIRDWMLI